MQQRQELWWQASCADKEVSWHRRDKLCHLSFLLLPASGEGGHLIAPRPYHLSPRSEQLNWLCRRGLSKLVSGPGCLSELQTCELHYAHSLKLGSGHNPGWNRAVLAELFAYKAVRSKSGRTLDKVAKVVTCLQNCHEEHGLMFVPDRAATGAWRCSTRCAVKILASQKTRIVQRVPLLTRDRNDNAVRLQQCNCRSL